MAFQQGQASDHGSNRYMCCSYFASAHCRFRYRYCSCFSCVHFRFKYRYFFAFPMPIAGHVSSNPSKLQQHPQAPPSTHGILSLPAFGSSTGMGFDFQGEQLSYRPYTSMLWGSEDPTLDEHRIDHSLQQSNCHCY